MLLAVSRHPGPLAARIQVGVCGFPKPEEVLFRTLRLVEVQQTSSEPPTTETALRWRRSAPEGFEFTARASPMITDEPGSPTPAEAGLAHDRYGLFRPTDEVFAAWARTKEAWEVLGATMIVFPSPPSFGPTAENRDNLYSFFRRADTRLVRAWEPPRGWPTHVVERICEDLGLQHATDPFAAELVDQPRAYYRLHGCPPGPTPYAYSYTDEDLAQILGYCEDVDEAYVLFDNVTMYEDALRFRELVDQR